MGVQGLLLRQNYFDLTKDGTSRGDVVTHKERSAVRSLYGLYPVPLAVARIAA